MSFGQSARCGLGPSRLISDAQLTMAREMRRPGVHRLDRQVHSSDSPAVRHQLIAHSSRLTTHMADSSFDIVSDFDRQELVNAVDQTRREMQQRYDLKNANASIELEKDSITIAGPSDFVL